MLRVKVVIMDIEATRKNNLCFSMCDSMKTQGKLYTLGRRT